MSVKLFTAPTDIDAKLAYLARVSSKNPDNPEYVNLMNYLINEGHWSPIDMLNIVVEVVTQKDVSIQILRHPFRVQEWSQRYADCSDMRAPLRECRLQDTKNRQNSLPCDDEDLSFWWQCKQSYIQEASFSAYEQALSSGVAKELARSVLPIGLTDTKLFLNGSIRDYLFYCKARMHHSTQKEHRIIANEVFKILQEVAPATTEAFSRVFNLEVEVFN